MAIEFRNPTKETRCSGLDNVPAAAQTLRTAARSGPSFKRLQSLIVSGLLALFLTLELGGCMSRPTILNRPDLGVNLVCMNRDADKYQVIQQSCIDSFRRLGYRPDYDYCRNQADAGSCLPAVNAPTR